MNGDGVLGMDAPTQIKTVPQVRHFTATDVNEIVHAVAGCSRPYLSENTILAVETSSDLPRIRGNHDHLTDVLFALLFRAQRSTSADTRTTAMICIRTGATDGEVRLHLSDNGMDAGIGESPAPGLLLGLTQCAEIISAHGGRMYAWRPNGGGARYTITLPAI